MRFEGLAIAPPAVRRIRGGLPLLLLLLALATMFPVGDHQGALYRPFTPHNWNSAKNLTLAEHLSAEHGFLMFFRLSAWRSDEAGKPLPLGFYNRFPVGGFALLKLAMLPFGDDLSAKILAARTLMTALFAGAAVLAFLALRRLVGGPWAALAATGLAFSSHHCLHYRDMVSNEGVMDLFAVMLVWHGMVVFVQEGRFRPLLAKTCAALLLGWHVYALLLPFIALGLGVELARAAAPGHPFRQARAMAVACVRSRHARLGFVALLLGLSVLSLQFANERSAESARIGGPASLAELPSYRSMLRRTGQDPVFKDRHSDFPGWPSFLSQQLHGVGAMFVPYAWPGYADALSASMTNFRAPTQPRFSPNLQAMPALGAVGAVGAALCLAGVWFSRHRILLGSLALAGFCWALPMRHGVSVTTDFEHLFHIGIPLVLFALALRRVGELWGERPAAGVAVAALLVFVASGLQMGRTGWDADAARLQAEVHSDWQAIRDLTEEGEAIGLLESLREAFVLRVDGEEGFMFMERFFHTAGRRLNEPRHLAVRKAQGALDSVPFVVTTKRGLGGDSLTPRNKRFFLWDRAAYVARHGSLFEELAAQRPHLAPRRP